MGVFNPVRASDALGNYRLIPYDKKSLSPITISDFLECPVWEGWVAKVGQAEGQLSHNNGRREWVKRLVHYCITVVYLLLFEKDTFCADSMIVLEKQ